MKLASILNHYHKLRNIYQQKGPTGFYSQIFLPHNIYQVTLAVYSKKFNYFISFFHMLHIIRRK